MLTIDDYQLDIQKAFYENDQTLFYKCEKITTKEKFLCKVLPIEKNFPDSLNELNVLQRIQNEQHMNIVKIYEIKQKYGFAYIFMETFTQNLEQFLEEGRIMIHDQISAIISQIVNGYKQLRKLKIILRNLNPSSIYIKIVQGQYLYKITDFTFSHFIEQRINSQAKSLHFAPEVFNMNGDQNYNEQCDIYSLGILIYRLYFQGSFPKKIMDQVQLIEFHNGLKINPFTCPPNQNINPEFIKLIQDMIVYDPNKRCTWEQLDRAPKLKQKFIIWKDKYLIDLTAVYGQGAQGLIFQTQDLQNNQTVLAKKVNIQTTSGKREKDIYQSLIGHNNQNVIKILDVCDIYQSQFCYLILEKGEYNLNAYFEQKKNFKKEEIIDFAQQIIDGYCFLKNQNIIHRDLKPDNIVVLFDSDKKPIYKIIDFGTGKILTQSNMPWTKAGTPLFQAPEVYRGGSEYDHTCDIFSFGFILNYIVFKAYPCDAQDEQQLKQWHELIKKNPLKCPIYEEPEIAKLIEKMLLYDRMERITWDQLQNHPLFEANRRNQLLCKKIIINEQPQIQHTQNTQNAQNTQNGQSKKFKIVEIQYQMFQNHISIVHMPSEQEFQTQQNDNTQQTNQQLIALNNQINIPPNEISFAEYIYQINQLTRKFIDEVEIFLNTVQEFSYQFELTLLTVFALRFMISCFVILDEIFDNKTIQIDQFKFQTDKTQIQKLNINLQEILNYTREKDQKLKVKIGLISSDLQVKKNFMHIKQKMDQEAKKNTGTSLEIQFTHYYYKLYYLTFRNQIIQITEFPLLLKFLLEKMSNLFIDFPVANPLPYKLKDIYFKIISNSYMENYLQNQRI